MSESRRFQIVLPAALAERLEGLAVVAGERPSTFAAQLVRVGIDRAVAGEVEAPPTRQESAPADRAPWLEPWGGDADWRAEMWAQIVALHGRYPTVLGQIKDRWWQEEQHVELLCALALWRARIDESGVDLREEFAFHAQLLSYAAILREQGAGAERAWRPGAAPPTWHI